MMNPYIIALQKRWTDSDGESLPNDFDEKVDRGEDLRRIMFNIPVDGCINNFIR